MALLNLFNTLFLLVCLAGCGSGVGYRQIDPNFQDYLDRFEAEGLARGYTHKSDDISIQFGKPEADGTGIYAQCQDNLGRYDIVVDRVMWQQEPQDSVKEQLMFHELGHCVLGRPHNPDKKLDVMTGVEAPVSLMYPSTSAFSSEYQINRSAYLDELFGVNQ